MIDSFFNCKKNIKFIYPQINKTKRVFFFSISIHVTNILFYQKINLSLLNRFDKIIKKYLEIYKLKLYYNKKIQERYF